VNLTQGRIREFIEALTQMGGSCGNKSLRAALKWDDEEFYWRVQGLLIGQGLIAAGQGKGGSVRLTKTDAAAGAAADSIPATTKASVIVRERNLYAPVKASIEGKWIKRFALDDVLVDETHSRGSKDTGGTFTRPDITAVGIRSYVFLPKRLEVVTFEIKPAEAVTIMGVLEAIAHREAAHRAYVIYATSRLNFDTRNDGDRITELAQKYGVGVVLAETPDDVENWEIVLDAIRHEPDPGRLDRFLKDLPGDNMKNQISKWKG
jgi:hypothetical protein